MNPIDTARYGLMAATRSFETSAVKIAGMGPESDVDLGEEMVGMIQAKHAFSANISVIRFAQDMWDSLLSLQTR